MKSKKTIGWSLIILGLLLIAWTLFSTFNIFTGKKSAPEIFKLSALSSEEKEIMKPANLSQEELQKEMEKMIGDQIGEIIPQEVIYKIMNLISWSVFATVLFLGGGKLSTIGIAMIKN